jgi:hypothetical protein
MAFVQTMYSSVTQPIFSRIQFGFMGCPVSCVTQQQAYRMISIEQGTTGFLKLELWLRCLCFHVLLRHCHQLAAQRKKIEATTAVFG